jgi:hypothetical protein
VAAAVSFAKPPGATISRSRQGLHLRLQHGRQRHSGIALSSDGKLIVAEVGAKRIIQIHPANGAVTEIAANLPIGLPAAPRWTTPFA